MNQYKEFLLKTLEMINYDQDKNVWVQQFLETSQQKAFFALLSTLPTEQQEILTSQLKSLPAGKTSEQVLQEFFTPLDCSIALQEQIIENYKAFVQQVMPTLPSEKQKELQDYLLPLVNATQ